MNNRKEQRQLRHRRIRQRIRGTAQRPRMAICVSNRHMYVQFIDDDAMRTLAATATAGRETRCNRATARSVGAAAAKAAAEKGIEQAVVDRGGFLYHGRVKELVEAAVAAGLKIARQVKAEEGSK
jgi:large subunit ribosomal protein L18